MKKFISILIAMVLIAAVGTTAVFADEAPTPVTLNYTAPNTYIINIPMELEVGVASTITVDEINVADGEKVSIYVEGLEDGYAILQHETDYQSSAAVTITANGAEMNTSNNLVGWFSGMDNSATDWEINSYLTMMRGNAKAGKYSGTIYFSMRSENF